MLGTFCSSAQNGNPPPVHEPDYNRASLFQDKPATVSFAKEIFAPLFDAPVGRTVSVNFSDESGFRFDGEVVSAVSKYNNAIQSVVVRSSNFPGARLAVSRITAEDGSVSFTGRIISLQHGDLYELKNNDNEFVLVKKKTNELLNE